MIRLSWNKIMGEGHHRSGWPYAMRSLLPLHREDGIRFEDYVESGAATRTGQFPQEPWIGVFHHPPRMPVWYQPERHLSAIFAGRGWKRSVRHLKLAVALSHYLGDWLRDILRVPTISVKHPTEIPTLRFSEEAYLANRDRRVLQIGWFLRNTEAIYELAIPPEFRKVRLNLPWTWTQRQSQIVREHELPKGRPRRGHVWIVDRVTDEQYDLLLSENVVFLQLYDVSACNVVIECIARNTPLIVNRHPALEEYLGSHYPLFYDRTEEAGELFDEARILAGHWHISRLDKSEFDGSRFRDRLANAIEAVLRGKCF